MLPQFFFRSQSLAKLYHTLFLPLLERYDLTQLEMDILLFVANNPALDTARDIVERRRLSKSHVSVGIDRLVKQGYLERFCRDGNRKVIHLRLLPAAGELVAAGRALQRQYGQILFQGFEPEELAALTKMLDRITDNAEQALVPPKERN